MYLTAVLAYIEKKGLRVINYDFLQDLFATEVYQVTVEERRLKKISLKQCYEGESNENLKYFLSHNLLNTKGTQ
jgi:hypothetical protein